MGSPELAIESAPSCSPNHSNGPGGGGGGGGGGSRYRRRLEDRIGRPVAITRLIGEVMVTGLGRELIVVTDADAEPGRVDGAMTDEEQDPEDGLGDEIQDAVKDRLGIGGDDVTPFGQAPGDRVEEPDEQGQTGAGEVGASDVGPQRVGVPASGPDDVVDDGQQSQAAKDKVAPLVG